MIENQVPEIRDLHENGPENTVDLTNSGVKSDYPDEQSLDASRISHPSAFPSNEGDDLRLRWRNIQGRFVDEPRHAVEEDDQLVGFVIGRLAEIFADERSGLEQQWSKGKPLQPKTCARVCASIVRSLTGCYLCKGRNT